MANILKYIAEAIDYERYLKEQYQADHESRWANVGELITFAAGFQPPKVDNADRYDQRYAVAIV